MSGKSLDDLDSGGGRSKGYISFMRRAAADSKKKNVGSNEIWGPIWEARNSARLFRLERRQTTKVVILNPGQPIIAHRIFYGWRAGKAGGRSFPMREDVRCDAWKLDDEGRWASTGKECKLCKFLGREPRLVILWELLDGREDVDRDTGKVQRWAPKRMIVDNDTIYGNIFDGVEVTAQREGREPSTEMAIFQVTRSADEKSYAYGTSWTFHSYADPSMSQIKEVMATGLIDWEAGWPYFTDDQIMAVITRHKEICDAHNLNKYSEEGAIRILQAKPKAENLPDSGTKESLDDLAEALDKDAKSDSEDGPSLNDLEDIPDEPKEEKKEDKPAKDDPDDEAWDPWKDGDV